MNISEKISPLSNYLSYSISTRQNSTLNKSTFDKLINQIQLKSKANDVYIGGLKKNLNELENKPNILQMSSCISWIDMYINSNIENITDKVIKSTEEVIAEYKDFASKNTNIEVSKEINNIKIKLDEYLNDPQLILEVNNLNNKKQYINKFMFNYTREKEAFDKFKEGKENLLNLFKEGYLNYNNISSKLDQINNGIKDVVKKIKEEYGLTFNDADNYVKEKNLRNINNSIKEFLSDKEADNSQFKIKDKIIFDNVNKTIIIFEDFSVAIKNNSKIKTVEDNTELKDFVLEIIQEELKNKFKKNPFTLKFFQKVIKECDAFEYGYAMMSIEKVIGTYTSNAEVLRLNEFNLEKSYKKIQSGTTIDNRKQSMYAVLEGLDDEMAAIIRSHKIKQYAHSIASNKYKHLYNEESYKQIEEIYNVYEGSDVLQNYIGKKIARFKTPEDFNDALKSFLKEMNNFSPENILNKAENFGVRVIHNENNQVILEISDYKQSKALGSPSWCIVRDEYYFDSYTKGCKQYFAYDFNLESSDISSLVGVTLNEKGQTTAAHYKDDEEIEDGDDLLIHLENTINDKKHFLETKIKKESHIQQNLF